MALSIVATVGGATSNSYVTMLEADSYFEARPHSSVWTAATTTERMAALLYATVMVDQMLIPMGYAAETTQALNWPRDEVVDCHGTEYLDTEIPVPIKNAQCEQALYLLTSDPTTYPAVLGMGFKRAKADVLEIEPDKSFVMDSLCPQAVMFLRCLGVLAPGAGADCFSLHVDKK